MKQAVAVVFVCLVVLFSGHAPPLYAQCNPSYDPGCTGEGDGLGPDISIGPNGGSYTISSDTSQSVTVTIRFSDADGVNRSSLKLTLTNGATVTTLGGFAWNASSGGTYAFGQIPLNLTSGGDNVLNVEIADLAGKVATSKAVFKITIDDSPLVINTAPHHSEFRNTNIGATVLTYQLPSYTSMDAERSSGLYYNSEHADPTAFVQLDVDINPRMRSQYEGGAITLQIFQPGTTTEVTSQFVWALNPSGMAQRVAAQWSARSLATGGYMYDAEVRAYRNDRTTYASKRVPVRVLVVNDSSSRYGAGWSPAGIQRMYGKSAGLTVTEGNGVVRYFEKILCSGNTCTFRTPAGDFSTMAYDHTVPHYVRMYQDGSKVTFSIKGLMTSVIDRFGRTTRLDWANTLDPLQLPVLTRVTDPAGKATNFIYGQGTHLTKIQDPAGREASLGYANIDLIQISGPTTLQAGYGDHHRLTSFTDAHGTWDVAYDQRGMTESTTAPAVTAGGAVVRPVERRASLQSVAVLTPNTTSVLGAWAPAIPSDQAFESVTDAGGHTTRTLRDRYGNALQIIDAGGATFSGKYNEHGLPLVISHPDRTFSYSWNAAGQLLSLSVNSAVIYHASYTTGDQPEYENIGGAGATWYSYGPRGEVLRTWYGAKEDVNRNATVYQYDANYRLIAVTDPRGERREASYETVWQNKAEDRLVRIDGTVLKTTFTYDEAGRPQTVVDPLGTTKTRTYDSLNRLRRMVTTPADLQQRTTDRTYSGLYLATVTDGSGKVYTFRRNALGWVEQEIFPDGKSRSHAYDLDGQRISRTDRRGSTVLTAYDASHRVKTQTIDGVQTTFAYPDPFTVVMKNNEVEETLETHFMAGVPYKSTFAFAGNKYVIEKILDEARAWRPGSLEIRRYSGTGTTLLRTDTIKYKEDFQPADTTLGAVLSVVDFAGRTTSLGFDKSGQLVKMTYPSGVSELFSHAGDGSLASTRFTGSAVNTQFGADFQYDALGRLTARSTPSADSVRSYEYDGFGQLTRYQKTKPAPEPGCDPSYQVCEIIQTPVATESYGYDAAGNRAGRGITLEANSNRYRTFGGYTLEYDAEGNLERKYKTGFNQTLTWDGLGRLTGVTTNGETVSYGYAPSGLRFRRTESGVTGYFLYHDGNLLLETDGTGNPQNAYTYLPGIDRPLSVRTNIGGQEYAYSFVTEQPGHVSGMLSSTGSIVSQNEYTPFGSETASGNGMRFMARERDFTSGLYYVRNRWYDTTIARFISEDPIGLAGGLNTYAYAGNDPMNYRDPSGLQAVPVIQLPPIEIKCSQWSDGESRWLDCMMIFDEWALQRATQDGLPGDYLRQQRRETRDQGAPQPAQPPVPRESRRDRVNDCILRTEAQVGRMVHGTIRARNEINEGLSNMESLGQIPVVVSEPAKLLTTLLFTSFEIGLIAGQGYNNIGCLLFPNSW